MAEKLRVTTHATIRYRERFEPELSQREARQAIERMLGLAVLVAGIEVDFYYHPSIVDARCVMVVKNGAVVTVQYPNGDEAPTG